MMESTKKYMGKTLSEREVRLIGSSYGLKFHVLLVFGIFMIAFSLYQLYYDNKNIESIKDKFRKVEFNVVDGLADGDERRPSDSLVLVVSREYIHLLEMSLSKSAFYKFLLFIGSGIYILIVNNKVRMYRKLISKLTR